MSRQSALRVTWCFSLSKLQIKQLEYIDFQILTSKFYPQGARKWFLQIFPKSSEMIQNITRTWKHDQIHDLDAIQCTKPSENRKFENCYSKRAFSQKPVPKAIRIEISFLIDLIWFIFKMVRSTLHVFVLDMTVMENWGSNRNLCDFARKNHFEK